jgi:hypothetical protein
MKITILVALLSNVALAQVVAPAAICPSYPSADLDGDGAAETFTEVEGSRGTGGATYELQLSNRGHPRRAGRVNGCHFYLGPGSSHGVRDLIAVWRGGANEGYETTLRFDGHYYRRLHGRRCNDERCGR